MTVAPDAWVALRDQLRDLRADLVERMAADGIEPAYLHLMAGVQATLGVIDASEQPVMPAEAGCPQPRNRGGDRYAAKRRQRDHAIRALADLVGDDLGSAEQQARELAGRLGRYRPMANEVSRERQLMLAVVETGLPVPGPDRIARIIRHR